MRARNEDAVCWHFEAFSNLNQIANYELVTTDLLYSIIWSFSEN